MQVRADAQNQTCCGTLVIADGFDPCQSDSVHERATRGKSRWSLQYFRIHNSINSYLKAVEAGVDEVEFYFVTHCDNFHAEIPRFQLPLLVLFSPFSLHADERARRVLSTQHQGLVFTDGPCITRFACFPFTPPLIPSPRRRSMRAAPAAKPARRSRARSESTLPKTTRAWCADEK